MTIKQKLFIRRYIEYKGNAAKAALAVYDVKPTVARQVGYENLTNPYIQEEIQRFLEPEELKLSVFIEKLASIAQTNPPKGYTGPDILKAIEIMLKLHGVLTDRKQVTQVSISTNYGDLTKLTKQELFELREKRQKETNLIIEAEEIY